MKFHSLRTSLMGCAFALFAAVMLGSCGGGGASTNSQGSPLTVIPATGTFYAGMANTITIVGGRRPYHLASSEPGLMPVPSTLNGNSFTVIPGNPGVIDTGIEEGELPVRTVIVSVADADGAFVSASIQVAQNFLTGYGISFFSNCEAVGTATTPPQACGGGETLVRVEANFNGALIGARTFRFETVRGPITWVHPDGGTGTTVTVVTDHEGKAFAVFRVSQNIQSQVGIIRVVDVETGVATEYVIPIVGNQLASELEIIPDEFTFIGPDSQTCGTGSGSFLVFDGQAPYSAFSTSGSVSVTPATSDQQPGRFNFTAGDPNTCLTDATIVVVDARNVRGTVTISTEQGTNDPPPPPLRAIPSSVTLTCAARSGSVVVAGGDPAATNVNASENDPALDTLAAGRTVTFDWNPPTPAGTTNVAPTITTAVTITDGTNVTSVSVRHPTDCI